MLRGAPESRMAMAYDLGDPTQVRCPPAGVVPAPLPPSLRPSPPPQNATIGSVHFRNKTEVGRRLALAVLNASYPVAADWAGPRVTDVTSNAQVRGEGRREGSRTLRVLVEVHPAPPLPLLPPSSQANLTVRVTVATWDGVGAWLTRLPLGVLD